MKNRDSAHPGRIKLTPVDEANGIYDMTRADEPRDPGTPLNKKLLDFAVAACGVTAGTATAYTLDDEFGGFTLTDGAKVNFLLHVASGANPTLNINGTGAKPITDIFGGPLPTGTPAGAWLMAAYSSALDAFALVGCGNMRIASCETLLSDSNMVEIPIPSEFKHARVLVSGLSVLNPINPFIYVLVNATSKSNKYMRQSQIEFYEDTVSASYTYNQDGYIFNAVLLGSDGNIEIELTFDGFDASCVARADMIADTTVKSTANGCFTFESANDRRVIVRADSNNKILAGAKIVVYGGN